MSEKDKEPQFVYDGQSMNAQSATRPNDNPMRLVLCLDGTQNEFGNLPFSNALRFFRLLSKDNPSQLCYYQPGVGVRYGISYPYSDPKSVFGAVVRRITLQLDSVFAFTFEFHVKAAYIFLMRFYRDGDYISLIGFSRGSFAARILVGMIECVGLLNKGLEDLVPTAWEIYCNWENSGQPGMEDYSSSLANEFKKTFSRSSISVHFMGLFDSVNSVGLIRDRMFPFTSRSAIVKHVRHAISLDERRGKFKQVLFKPYSYYPHLSDLEYEECDSATSDSRSLRLVGFSYFNKLTEALSSIFGKYPTKRVDDDCHCPDIQELVFPGNHGDIGGGWKDTGTNQCLSNISLRWMLSQAIKFDISFKPGSIHEFDSLYPVTSSFLSFNHDMLRFKRTVPLDSSIKLELPDHAVVGNNRSGQSDYLLVIFWWLIELLPIGIKIEDENGKWKRIYVPNLGRARKFPEGIQLHWSLFYRLHYFKDYNPVNLPADLAAKLKDLLKSFHRKFDQDQLEDYCKGLDIGKIKSDWQSEIWHTLPDELEEILKKNPDI